MATRDGEAWLIPEYDDSLESLTTEKEHPQLTGRTLTEYLSSLREKLDHEREEWEHVQGR